MKTYKYLIQDLLPQIHKLLEQLVFQVGGPGSSARTEAVQGVMKLDCQCVAEIQDPCHGITEDLVYLDAAEIAVPLWDQDVSLPGILLRKVTLTESCLDQAYDHLPFRGVM